MRKTLQIFFEEKEEDSEEEKEEEDPEEEDPAEEEEEDPEEVEPEGKEKDTIVTQKDFINKVMAIIPNFEKFEDFGSLLPNTIDLEDIKSNNDKVEGFRGAQNFLRITGLDLNLLDSEDRRIVENQIDKLNKTITADFQEFWTQKIGRSSKISIQFELKHHDVSKGDKAGTPFLVFWIIDGEEKLYPKQRSQGVRWFLSFYLHLKANAINRKRIESLFLIDEPGGSLHAKAQGDVLRIFEDIKKNTQVIYTTHSPYLIEIPTMYRLLAVQRVDETDDKSDTEIIEPHKFASATTDTLSPLYTKMGVPFHGQQVIKPKNNILL